MSVDDSQSDLLRLAVTGDRAALSQLLLLHYDELSSYIASRISPDLQSLIRADDILQQSFVRAAQAIGGFAPQHSGSFRGWLKTIASNLVKDAAKRRRRERRAATGAPGQRTGVTDESAAALVERIAGDSTSPSGQVQRRESIYHMRVALASLPADQREVIQRRYLQGQSLEEIAAAMGRTKDGIRGICYRARRNLRAMMGGSSLFFSG